MLKLKSKKVLSFALAFTMALSVGVTGAYAKEKKMEKERTAYLNFTAKLLKHSLDKKKNTLISPLSVFYAMGMTTNGARKRTKTELEKAFGMRTKTINKLAEKYMEAEDKLKIANAIWFKEDPDFKAKKSFLDQSKKRYLAEVEKAPFDANTLLQINKWVEEKTDGRIKNILDKINEDAVMYLVNALAFEAEWVEKYKEHNVRKMDFNAYDGTKEKAEMMFSEEGTYLEDGNTTGFMKPYKDSKYAFVCLLPEKETDLLTYVKKLNGRKLANLLSTKQNVHVDAGLPAFKTEFHTEMSGVFGKMGVKDAFDVEKANFKGIGTSKNGKNLVISRILHKTFIEVDLAGTKAGAATVVEMLNKATAINPETAKRVTLDRPFVYMILDTETNLPVFIGTTLSI